MKICVLGSSSSGNCCYVEVANNKILIDLGYSLKKIEQGLSSINVDIKEINAVFITHEHIDHSKSIGPFLRKYDANIYIHRKSFEIIKDKIGKYDINRIKFLDKKDIYLNNAYIVNFELMHDSNHCLGFSFHEYNKKFVYITDTGHISKIVEFNCMQADVMAIESNYDLDMLMLGSYPWNTKNRIKSKFGHLSNEDCLNLLKKMNFNKLKKVFLMHLSKENNNPKLALENIKSVFPNLDVSVASDEPLELIEI